MHNASDIQYRCRKTDGTGTAGEFLTPLVQAWADSKKLTIVPGTLNLCADRDLVCRLLLEKKQPWDAALNMPRRKATAGYDPRLYFVVLNSRHPAWMFRWPYDPHMGNFAFAT